MWLSLGHARAPRKGGCLPALPDCPACSACPTRSADVPAPRSTPQRRCLTAAASAPTPPPDTSTSTTHATTPSHFKSRWVCRRAAPLWPRCASCHGRMQAAPLVLQRPYQGPALVAGCALSQQPTRRSVHARGCPPAAANLVILVVQRVGLPHVGAHNRRHRLRHRRPGGCTRRVLHGSPAAWHAYLGSCNVVKLQPRLAGPYNLGMADAWHR